MVEPHLVENPEGDDLEFEGELLIDERSHDIGFVKIWKTVKGRYVLKQSLSTRPGVRIINRVEIFDTAQLLAHALGNSTGAKGVARSLGIPRTTIID